MLFPLRRHSQIYQTKCGPKPSQFLWLEPGASNATTPKRSKYTIMLYSRLPFTRHGILIWHPPFIWTGAYTRRWGVIMNRIRMQRKSCSFNWTMPLFWSAIKFEGGNSLVATPYIWMSFKMVNMASTLPNTVSILWAAMFIHHMIQTKWVHHCLYLAHLFSFVHKSMQMVFCHRLAGILMCWWQSWHFDGLPKEIMVNAWLMAK